MADLPLIEALLPHRGAMRFLDEALELAADRAVCRGVVRPDNPFVRDGLLDPVAVMEFIAQAAAALVSSRSEAGPVRGLLVGGRHLDFAEGDVPAGATLTVDVVEAARVGDFASFDGVVRLGDREIGRGNVKVFRTSQETP